MKRYFFFFIASLLIVSAAWAQAPASSDTTKKAKRKLPDGIVKKVSIMPYATISANFQSGQAFPKSAQGIGYGFGVAFDMTEEKQPLGFYFDLAYQDMRASAEDGACKPVNPDDSISVTVPVDHYFSYALVEAFLKLQSEKANGYFLVGISTGVAIDQLTVKRGPGKEVYSDWSSASFSNAFRFDVRAGLGLKLFKIDDNPVIFEARFGYPITAAITDYNDYCNGNNASGPWRVLSLQGNIGVRF
jgi:hypothetical protein